MSDVIKVSKNDLVKAVEFYSNTNQEPNWLDLKGKSFKEFFFEEEIGSFVNVFDTSAYTEWLKAWDNKKDNNENYNEWLVEVKDSIKGMMKDELEDGTQIEYID